METLLIDADAIEAVTTMDEVVRAVEAAFAADARGNAQMSAKSYIDSNSAATECPEMIAESLDVSASLDGGWRIVRVTGPTDSLDALEEVYLNPEICNDCTFPHPACDGDFEYDVIESSPTARTIYKYASDVSYCHSVTFLALTHFGEGLVFHTEQRGPAYRYRVLVPREADMGGFQKVLDDGLPGGVTLNVERVGETNGLERPMRSWTGLPPEQQQALEAAWRMGYYETPRRSQLADIAAELDLPLTTLRYRLRRAEAWGIGRVLETVPSAEEREGSARLKP